MGLFSRTLNKELGNSRFHRLKNKTLGLHVALHLMFPFSPAADVEKVEDRAPIENPSEPPIITLDEKGES